MYLYRFNQLKSISSSEFVDGYLALLLIALILIILFGFVFWIAWIITGYRQWKNGNRVITTTEYLWIESIQKIFGHYIGVKLRTRTFWVTYHDDWQWKWYSTYSFYCWPCFLFDLKLIAFLRFKRNLECIYFKMNMKKKNKETKVNKEKVKFKFNKNNYLLFFIRCEFKCD